MKIIKCKDYDEVSKVSAEIVADVIKAKPDCIIGLATGSTPLGLYNGLVERYEAGELDFSKVSSFNLDEYYPISPENDQSYRYFMNKNLFDRINIDKANTHVPCGTAKDPEAAAKEYEDAIDASAGVDIQVLGIGRNGHIAFNEPEEKLYAYTHVTGLTADTIDANSRFFASKDEVPTKAMTMGMASIMKARAIIILITGANKHEALMQLLDDRITTDCPASLLKLHGNVTVVYDEAALNG